MHRRGFKSELASPSVEQFPSDAILSGSKERGRPGRVEFGDPDYVTDVETVGNRAGVTLWPAATFGAFRFFELIKET